MPDLSFQVQGARVDPAALAPQLALELRIACADAEEAIASISLRCQVQIQAPRRRYGPGEQEKLLELFGEPHRWGQTLRPMLWTQTHIVVPAFIGSTTVDLPLACTFDFNVAATKYFHALEGGEVPLCLLFSGTIFYPDEGGGLRVAQIPWEKEATHRLPVRVWQEMMDRYYPNTAWLGLRRDVFERLYQYRSRGGFTTWEQALESLLPPAGQQVKS